MSTTRFDEEDRQSLKKVLPHVVPNYLAHNDTSVAVEAGREMVKKPFTNFPYTPSQRLARLDLPDTGVYDFSRAFLAFTASCSATGGTYCRFSNGIHNLINRIRLLEGTMPIQTIEDYNLLHSCLWEVGRQRGIDSTIAESLFGYGSQAQRNTWSTSRDYRIPINLPCLLERVVDFSMLNNIIRIEIQWEDPSALIETDGTAPTYTIEEVYLHIEHLKKMSPQYRSKIRGLKGLHWTFDHWESFKTSLDSNRKDYVIPLVKQSLLSLVCLSRDAGTINSTTTNDKFEVYNYNNLNSVRIKLNEELWPEEIIPASGQATDLYMELLKFLGHWSSKGVFGDLVSLSADQWKNDKFVLALDLEDHPDFMTKYVNYRDAPKGANFTLQLRYAAGGGGATTPQELICFVHSRGFMAITDGRIKIVNTQ